MKRWAVLAAATLAGCTPARNGEAVPDGGTATVSQGSRVSLERTPCFGTCPVYRVSVSADGTVTFEGERFVEHTGTATARIAADSAAALMRSLERDGFFDLESKYTMDAKACGAYHTDAPRVILTLELDGRRKTIEHDYGCNGAPAILRELQERVDRVVGAEKWVGRLD